MISLELGHMGFPAGGRPGAYIQKGAEIRCFVVIPCLNRRSNLRRKEARRFEIVKSDHDHGPFGRSFEFGSLCSQAGNNNHKRGHHDRLLQVIDRVGLYPADGPLTKGPGRFRPGLSRFLNSMPNALQV